MTVVDDKTLIAQASEHLKKERFDEAISTLKTLLENQPRHEIGNGLLGSIYAQIGMHERAIPYYETVLKDHPNNPLARFHLGLAQLTLEKPQAALDTWSPMLTQDDEYHARFYSGIALTQLGDPAQARTLFEQSAQHMPVNHPLYPDLQKILTQKHNA